MKKNLTKIILISALAAMPLFAAQNNKKEESIYKYNSYSLLAFEGGYSSFDYESNSTPPVRKSPGFAYGGIKIGAQTENYRLFLSARYCPIDNFDYAYTMGAEAQYLFNFSKMANFYVGVNAGIAEMRFVDATNLTRDISDPYVGGDMGFNIHLGENADLELGVRVMSLNAENTKAGVTYTFDTIASGYTSIIFKFQMD